MNIVRTLIGLLLLIVWVLIEVVFFALAGVGWVAQTVGVHIEVFNEWKVSK